MMKSIPVLFACIMLLAACGRSTPTNYYLLESTVSPLQSDSAPGRTLRVAQIETPAYLGRNNIVSRVAGQTRVILAEFHLWAEPVANGCRRIIEENLTRPMLADGIYVLPCGTEEHGDFVLVVDVQRLDGNFDEKAVLEARWTLLDRGDQPLGRGIYADEEQVAGADYSILAAAESRLVARFADHLAGRLPALIGKNNK